MDVNIFTYFGGYRLNNTENNQTAPHIPHNPRKTANSDVKYEAGKTPTMTPKTPAKNAMEFIFVNLA